MTWKCWNIRDETTSKLEDELKKCYRLVEDGYRLLRKIASLEEAKLELETIFRYKRRANDIDTELLRRKIYGASQENETQP